MAQARALLDNEGQMLPSTWARTTLGEISHVNRRDPALRNLPDNAVVSFVPMAAVDGEQGSIAWQEERLVSAVRKGFTPFSDGDVLFAKITPCMENGKAAIADGLHNGRGFGSTEFHVLTPREGVSSKWLFYFVRQQSFRHDAKRSFTGTAGQLRVPSMFLLQYPIPLAPAAEQKRIVAAIETQFTRLDAGVAGLKAIGAKLKRYRAAVLKAAVEGTLTAAWRAEHPDVEPASALLPRILLERRSAWEQAELARFARAGKTPPKGWQAKYSEPLEADNDSWPELPKGWCWASVTQLAAAEGNSITDGPFGSNLKTEHYTVAGPRVIRLQNIGDGVFRDDKACISVEHFQKLRKHEVFAGDLVIAALGDDPPRSCIIPPYVGPAIVKADCIRFKPSPHVSSPYVNYALNAERIRRRTASLIHGIGRPRLNLTEIKSIAIPLPPVEEQEQIVAEVDRRLSVVAEVEAQVEAGLKRAERLRQSILQQAFAGKLVPQDPNDEPAAVLLERIRAQKAKGVARDTKPTQLHLV